MTCQRCPGCRERVDVSVYVHGQRATCPRCGIRFSVDREKEASDPASRVSMPREAATQLSAPRGIASAVTSPAAHAGPPTLPSQPQVVSLRPAPPPMPDDAFSTGQLFPPPAPRQPEPAPVPAPGAPSPLAQGQIETAVGAPRRPEIPGYECTALLGRGGMGEVWRARQLSLDRIVAVKFLSPALAVEPDFVRRFERESKALASLAHPNVVQIIDRGCANGHWFFAMEFVDGRSLRDRVQEQRPTRAEILRLLAQVARAVDYAHKHGVVHRDLKPENVLVDRNGLAKVADFGLAGMSEVGRSSLTMSAVAMGTAHYMAPEQRRDAKKVDGRADLYSLGVMLYELMTGELPTGRFAAPRQKVPDLDARLDAMILKLLEPEPHKRPGSGVDVAELLERVASGGRGERLSMPVATTKALSSVVRGVRLSPARKAMAAAAAVLLLAGVGLAVARAVRGGIVTGHLPASLDRSQPRSAQVVFGTGAQGALFTVGEGWSVEGAELVRDAASLNDGKRQARAYLKPVRLDLKDASLEADVVVDETGSKGSEGPPAAEVLLYRDLDRHVGLRMALAEDASFSLFYALPAKGRAAPRTEEGAAATGDPQPARRYHLAVTVLNGRATASVNNRPVASVSVPELAGVKAKAALGCRVGRCRFANVRLSGTLADPPAPPAPPRK